MPTICSACGGTSGKCAQPLVPPTDCRRAKIREVLLANGYTIKEGQTDLKDYVYVAAEALLAAYESSAT
jgi:hypothetical protein